MKNKKKDFEWPPKIKITYKIEPQKIEFIEYELNPVVGLGFFPDDLLGVVLGEVVYHRVVVQILKAL